MKNITKRIGFVAACTGLAAFVVYTACFTAILFVNEPYTWTDLAALVVYERGSHTVFKYLGMACMIVFSLAYALLTLCFARQAQGGRGATAQMALLSGSLFCALISVNYFVQLTATRLQLRQGPGDGLLQFTQSYNLSALNAVNMLGWTVVYGLSTLALAFAVPRGALRFFCLLNAAFMAAGLIGYFFNHFLTLLLTMNLGLGGAGLGILVCCLCRFAPRARAGRTG